MCRTLPELDLGAVLARRPQLVLVDEFAHLLRLLVRHAGKVLTHRQLLRDVWGPGHEEHTHHLRVYIAHLREKIEADASRPQRIITEPGVGYRLLEG
ncbi:MAG: winged helix-turn-helix domain-containing protein [Verrucomicrobiae bacterium]|nr:winged helix-turn-helix domain-containing protein [Verrucomicrobiae bacterium]